MVDKIDDNNGLRTTTTKRCNFKDIDGGLVKKLFFNKNNSFLFSVESDSSSSR